MFPKNVFIMLNFDQTDLSLQIDNDHVGDWSEVCECVDDGDVGRVLVGLDVQADQLRIAQPRSDVDVAVVQVSHALCDRRFTCSSH
jgi:hypothetical protein